MSWVRRLEDPTPWGLYTFSASVAGSKAESVLTTTPPRDAYHPSSHNPVLKLVGTTALVALRRFRAWADL